MKVGWRARAGTAREGLGPLVGPSRNNASRELAGGRPGGPGRALKGLLRPALSKHEPLGTDGLRAGMPMAVHACPVENICQLQNSKAQKTESTDCLPSLGLQEPWALLQSSPCAHLVHPATHTSDALREMSSRTSPTAPRESAFLSQEARKRAARSDAEIRAFPGSPDRSAARLLQPTDGQKARVFTRKHHNPWKTLNLIPSKS